MFHHPTLSTKNGARVRRYNDPASLGTFLGWDDDGEALIGWDDTDDVDSENAGRIQLLPASR